MIKALVLDCGRPILHDAYVSTFDVLTDIVPPAEITSIEDYDLVILPSSMQGEKIAHLRNELRQYLNKNGVVFCFSGTCIDYLPGNTWKIDEDIPSIHYTLYDDTYGFFKDVDLDILNGIDKHGWKSEGYIKSENDVQVVVCSYEQLPVMVVDEITTSGTIVITAGLGMLEKAVADLSHPKLEMELKKVYENMLTLVLQRNNSH